MPKPSKYHHNIHKSNNEWCHLKYQSKFLPFNDLWTNRWGAGRWIRSTVCRLHSCGGGPPLPPPSCPQPAPGSQAPREKVLCEEGGAGPPMLPHQGQGEPADSHREAACPGPWPFQRELERQREGEREKEGWKDRRRRGCGLALPAGSHANFS